MQRIRIITILSFVACFFIGCGKTELTDKQLDDELQKIIKRYPSSQLTPKLTPAQSQALIDLGKELFFSKSLSGNFDVACASCHHPELAGGDGLSLSVGEKAYNPDIIGFGRWHDWRNSNDPKANGGPNVPRNASTTFNSFFFNRALFHDGRVFSLDSTTTANGANQRHHTPDSRLGTYDPKAGENLLATQARFPVTSPEEMRGFSNNEVNANSENIRSRLAARLMGTTKEISINDATKWFQLFRKAYNDPNIGDDKLITFKNIQTALAAYQSSQIFINNPWYSYIKGNSEALTKAQKKGALIFFNPSNKGGAGCAICHTPPTFTDERFHNIAAPQIGRGKHFNQIDNGRREATQNNDDRFKFRTPSLLNITETSPYTHAGAFYSLKQTIEHHLAPEASLNNFDFSMQDNPQMKYVSKLYPDSKKISLMALKKLQETNDSLLPQQVSLTEEQLTNLIAFLSALTDPCITSKECLSFLLPNEKQESPDGQRLKAIYAEPSSPPLPIKTNVEDKVKVRAKKYQIANSKTKWYVRCEKEASSTEKHSESFTEVTNNAGITHQHTIPVEYQTMSNFQLLAFTSGVATGDINGDCLPDLYFSSAVDDYDKVYINQGRGKFKDSTEQWLTKDTTSFTNGVAMADINGDGLLDTFVSTVSKGKFSDSPQVDSEIKILINNGKKLYSLENHGIKASHASWSISLADYDTDGDLDILTTHWQSASSNPNILWRNQNAKFTPIDTATGISILGHVRDVTFTGTFTDYNFDGFLDLLLVADFENTQVLKNNGDASFSVETHKHQIDDENGMGTAVADYDNDGDFDWFVTSIWDSEKTKEEIHLNWGSTGNRLYNYDNGKFTSTAPTGVAEGGWAWGACFADFNNDGLQDIFHVNGFKINQKTEDYLTELSTKDLAHLPEEKGFLPSLRIIKNRFSNTANKLAIASKENGFIDSTEAWGITERQQGRAVICFDYDRDGDTDILISNNNQAPTLYRNNTNNNGNHFINIKLQGLGKNTNAIGAKVYVTTKNTTQLKEVRAGGSFLSSEPLELHFGLGSHESIDEIKIIWPRPSYYSSSIKNIKANQFIMIEQPDS